MTRVAVLHREAPIHRIYSYTIALELLDKAQPTGTYVYLDPRIVDVGGPVPEEAGDAEKE